MDENNEKNTENNVPDTNDENSQKDEKKQDSNIGLGMCIGLALGPCLGIISGGKDQIKFVLKSEKKKTKTKKTTIAKNKQSPKECFRAFCYYSAAGNLSIIFASSFCIVSASLGVSPSTPSTSAFFFACSLSWYLSRLPIN